MALDLANPAFLWLSVSLGLALLAVGYGAFEREKPLPVFCVAIGVALVWPLAVILGVLAAVLWGVWSLCAAGIQAVVVLVRGYRPSEGKTNG